MLQAIPLLDLHTDAVALRDALNLGLGQHSRAAGDGTRAAGRDRPAGWRSRGMHRAAGGDVLPRAGGATGGVPG